MPKSTAHSCALAFTLVTAWYRRRPRQFLPLARQPDRWRSRRPALGDRLVLAHPCVALVLQIVWCKYVHPSALL